MTCVLDGAIPALPIAIYVVPSVIGAVMLCMVLLLGFVYWRRLASDVANYKQMWHKRRYVIAVVCHMPHEGSSLTDHSSCLPVAFWLQSSTNAWILGVRRNSFRI